MLLRRITQHVKDQNWFAVALDFFIVVLGILIAFQITTWNESLQDRGRETSVLQELEADLRSDVIDFTSSLSGTLDKVAAIEYVLKNSGYEVLSNPHHGLKVADSSYNTFIEKSELLVESSFAKRVLTAKNNLWEKAVVVVNTQPSTTAFDSVVASGELGILQNESIVRGLQKYRLIITAIEKAQDTTFRPQRNSAINVGHTFGLSVFSEIENEALFQLIANNIQLKALLQSQLGWAKAHFSMLSTANEIAVQLLKQIENELQKE